MTWLSAALPYVGGRPEQSGTWGRSAAEEVAG